MANLNDTDLFLVGRGKDSFKIEYQDLQNNLDSSVEVNGTAPSNPEEGDLWWADTDTDNGGGRLYVWTGSEWVDVSLPGNALDADTADTRYLSRLSDDTAKGAITFEGTTTHEEGICVTGAASDTTKSRVNGGTNFINIARSRDLGGDIAINSGGLASLNCASTSTTGVVASGAITYPNSSTGTDIYNFRQQVKVPENSSKDINGITSWFAPKNNTDNYTGDVRLFNASLGVNVAASYNNVYGYWSSGQIANTSQISGLRVGFGAVMDNTSDLTFAFHSDGTANNFFKGTTYIGGTTAPNTFELYKSTLTEEQLEQLEAGTLVAPANVSLPGDGSFARQWYYNQQDADTQAELDAGTLEYPTHLAAATFTDTFALGDNTAINLLSNGTAYFGNNIAADNTNTGVGIVGAGIVTARRAADSNVWVGYETGNDVGTSFIKSNGRMGLGGQPFLNSVFQITGSFAGKDGDGLCVRADAVLTAGDNAGSVCGIDSRISTTDTGSELIQFRATGIQSTDVTQQIGFAAADTLISELADQATPVYGFFSNLSGSSSRVNTYNFYAKGTAPNYFKGITEHAGGVKVTGGSTSVNDGLVRYANGSLGLVSNSIDVFRISQAAGKEGYFGFNATNPVFPLTFRLDFDDSIERYCDFTPTHQGTLTGVSNIVSSWVQDAGSNITQGIIFNALSGAVNGTTEKLTGFRVNKTLAQASTVSSIGFDSDLSGGGNYNFYAAGSAPNYFRGNIKVAYDPDVDTLNPQITNNTGIVQIQPHGYIQISRRSGNTEDGCIVMRRAAKGDGLFMRFQSATGADTSFSEEGAFRLNGYGGGILGEGFNITTFSIDSRLQSNVQSIDNASALVQQLNPISFTNTKTGLAETNFTAVEVETVAPQAVYGSQDATQAIGTLADYDGTVLETAVVEPEELEYTEEVDTDGVTTATVRTRTWTPSGTRPVYQGVDQTKLIPLLTKALQEVMTKNEELETRLAALEGGNN